jgi:chromosome segregation ATPase
LELQDLDFKKNCQQELNALKSIIIDIENERHQLKKKFDVINLEYGTLKKEIKENSIVSYSLQSNHFHCQVIGPLKQFISMKEEKLVLSVQMVLQGLFNHYIINDKHIQKLVIDHFNPHPSIIVFNYSQQTFQKLATHFLIFDFFYPSTYYNSKIKL